MESEKESEKMKHVIVTGVFAVVAAAVTGIVGLIYGESSTQIVINNQQGETVKVGPNQAEREYADLYSRYLDLKQENNQLKHDIGQISKDKNLLQQTREQRDQLQNMLQVCEAKVSDTSLVTAVDPSPAAATILGKWKGQIISEDIPVVVSLDVDALDLGERSMTITYGSPRNCTAQGEYAGTVDDSELFYLREPTPRTWCNQFTYFTDATIKLQRTLEGKLSYEIRDIRKFKKTIERAVIPSKS